MHALAGIISPLAPPRLAEPPHRMLEPLCQSPSHLSGYTTFDRLGLFAGWVSDRDTPAANAPGWSDSGQVAVLLAGGDSGHGPVTTATLGRLATHFETDPSAALRSIHGWFHGLVIDRRDDTVTLFNDRFGLGRVYLHASDRGFFFSSQAKALLAVLPHLRRLDPQGVAEMFAVGCVLRNRSLFTGIELLPPGSAWRFHRDGRIERARYFDAATWENQTPLSAADYHASLHETFARAATRCLGGSAPVAMSLTGGLDSRAVIAWAGSAPGSLPCYTFGGPFRDCADVLIARRLAGICRHPHTTIRIGPEFFRDFGTLATQSVYLSDGAMDVSGAVELHVNRLARAIAPVRLTGNYGSEILRAHIAFRPGRLDRSLFTPEFCARLDAAAATYRTEATGHRLSFIAFKQVPWHHHARFAVEKSQLAPRSPFLDHDLVALAYRAPRELQQSPAPMLELIARGNPSLARIGTDRALRAGPLPLLSHLAHRWQEFTAKAEYAYDYGMPRWLTRADHAFHRLRLERLFLGRHKFYHFRIWYRDALRPFVAEHGSGSATQPFCYRPGAARQLAHEHLGGHANRTLELHQLLSLQLIERTLLR